VDPIFAWVERSGLSRWVCGPSFEPIIVFHTLGVGFVAGPCLIVALRLLGVARGVPLQALRGFFPLVNVGLIAAVPSGVLLLIGYPTKALTNPVFYLKLAAIALGLVVLGRIDARLLSPSADGQATDRSGQPGGATTLAWASIVLWLGAIISGRLLAYTYTKFSTAF
jgi:hypothetical protein